MQDYGRRIIVDAGFGRTVDAVVSALHHEGLDVLNRFDVRAYLRRRIDHDFRRYMLLQVAAPDVMLQALRDDLGVGAILPSTIAIHELADGETAVVASEPFGAVLEDRGWRASAPDLARLADDESRQVARMLARVEHEVAAAGAPAA
jgi:uncharacterized protein (DUF302 family)